MKSIWCFTHKFKIQLDIVTPPLSEIKENDLFVMNEFVAQGFSKAKLANLNACRKYLQIVTLGEITK